MEMAAAQLAARLARNGGTSDEWELLAKSYDFLGKPDDAKRARQHVATAPVATAGALIGAAKSLDVTPGAASAAANEGANTAEPPADDARTADELERRLHKNPRDTQALLDLAELHRRHHDYVKARDTYAKLIVLNAMTAPAWADEADVLASLSGGSLAGEPARAIDRALALDPANPKALWLKASLAHQERRYADALVLWKTLRASLPPDSPDMRLVDANIAEAAQLAGLPPEGLAKGGAQTVRSDGAVPAMSAGADAGAAAAAAEVAGTVSIDSHLASRVQRDATLFIYAKAADSPGPPLAVMRLTAGSWPVSFRLDDSMAMMPSRRLSQFDKVVVEARVSRTGQATPSPGDLYVTSTVVKPSDRKKLALIINREIG